MLCCSCMPEQAVHVICATQGSCLYKGCQLVVAIQLNGRRNIWLGDLSCFMHDVLSALQLTALQLRVKLRFMCIPRKNKKHCAVLQHPPSARVSLGGPKQFCMVNSRSGSAAKATSACMTFCEVRCTITPARHDAHRYIQCDAVHLTPSTHINCLWFCADREGSCDQILSTKL